MESWDIVDEDNNLINLVETKEEALKHGSWHRTIRVWFSDDEGNILMQKRSKNKDIHPGQWSTLAGHILAGETPGQAILREAKEEMDININSALLILLGEFKHIMTSSKGDHKHFTQVFVSTQDVDLKDIKFTDGEVDEVKYISPEFIKEKLEEGDPEFYELPEFEKLFRFV